MKTVLVIYKKFQSAPHPLLDDTYVKQSKIVEVSDLTDLDKMFQNIVDVKILEDESTHCPEKVEQGKYFKAFIRVVKSLSNEKGGDGFFGSSLFGAENIVEERLIEAKDKKGVLDFLLNKYPQFFPENKIYTRETKDQAQFFYVVIFELYEYEVNAHKESWKCSHCNQQYESKYLHKPVIKYYNENLYFCNNDFCDIEFKKNYYAQNEIPDDKKYINTDICYIYKITEKGSGKCYIGKTLNAPFFRWWNHLTHSGSPFGIYFRQSNLSNWTFEVLEILEKKTDSEVFEIESNYIKLYDSIANGFNTLISKKAKTDCNI